MCLKQNGCVLKHGTVFLSQVLVYFCLANNIAPIMLYYRIVQDLFHSSAERHLEPHAFELEKILNYDCPTMRIYIYFHDADFLQHQFILKICDRFPTSVSRMHATSSADISCQRY